MSSLRYVKVIFCDGKILPKRRESKLITIDNESQIYI
jgi:hypothetical protein